MKINSGLNAGGFSQPEIRPGDKWKDNSGDFIIIKSFSPNRVTFIREGYEHECICSPERLFRDFILQPQHRDLSRFERAKGTDEKIRVMREIIQERKSRK